MNANPCRNVRAHLSDQLDGEPLPPLTRVMVRLHLTICPPCRRVNRSLVATRDALRALRDVDVETMGAPLGAAPSSAPKPPDSE
jgi:predicted anti-sigma-YlaC factor YlaD